MCPHEGSTTPTSGRTLTAWRLIDDQDGPMHHLYNLDSMIRCVHMAIEHLNEESTNPDLCHVAHLLTLADMELTQACGGLEEKLGHVFVHA
jgi:hypothetical protein